VWRTVPHTADGVRARFSGKKFLGKRIHIDTRPHVRSCTQAARTHARTHVQGYGGGTFNYHRLRECCYFSRGPWLTHMHARGCERAAIEKDRRGIPSCHSRTTIRTTINIRTATCALTYSLRRCLWIIYHIIDNVLHHVHDAACVSRLCTYARIAYAPSENVAAKTLRICAITKSQLNVAEWLWILEIVIAHVAKDESYRPTCLHAANNLTLSHIQRLFQIS